jgi:hypothetical protein
MGKLQTVLNGDHQIGFGGYPEYDNDMNPGFSQEAMQ